MISLKTQEEPFDIEIMSGVSFKVRPLTTFDMNVAQSDARKALERMTGSLDDVYYAGLLPNKNLDLSDPAICDGLYHEFLVGALAERHIVSWSGITDEQGNDIDVATDGAARMAVRIFPIGQIFYNKLTAIHLEILSAKKDCGTVSVGTSNAVAVPDIAKDVKKAEHPVPQEKKA